jgi:hypothetical protein
MTGDPLDRPPADYGSDRYDYIEVSSPPGVTAPAPPLELYEHPSCLDCRANLFLRWDGSHWHRTVAHDDGCPTFNAVMGSG